MMAPDLSQMQDALRRAYETRVALLYGNLVTALADIDDDPNDAKARFTRGLQIAGEAYVRAGEAIANLGKP
jgi:hypothetical protein